MIKCLINIFYIKYIMEDIFTFDRNIAEKNNFLRLGIDNIWINPKYLHENKYILYLKFCDDMDAVLYPPEKIYAL